MTLTKPVLVILVLLASLALYVALNVGKPPAKGQPVSIHAGSDQTVSLEEQTILNGGQSILSPLEFWLADGDGPLEDRLVQYHSVRGVRSIGTMRDAVNNTFGWPTDMVWVGSQLIGIDPYNHRIALIEPTSCSFRYLTPRLEECELMQCLAYDGQNDRLLVVAATPRKLYQLNLDAGTAEHLCTLDLTDVTGMAFDESSANVLLYDQATRAVYRVQPLTGATELVTSLPVDDKTICDELTPFNGNLYGSFVTMIDDMATAQVCRIDLATGQLHNVGPRIENTVGHTLVMMSMPEEIHWRLVRGPAEVRIASPHSLSTAVEFVLPGVYTFELAVRKSPELADRVTITVESRGGS